MDTKVKPRWFEVLACPDCKQPLDKSQAEHLLCRQYQAFYAVRQGIPILMNRDSLAEHQALLETSPGRHMVAEYQSSSFFIRITKAIRRLVNLEYIPNPPEISAWIDRLGPEALAV